MVIQCSECQTRFRLADDKLKPGGVKVRCSKCRHIFTVLPPAPETPAAAVAASEEPAPRQEEDAFNPVGTGEKSPAPDATFWDVSRAPEGGENGEFAPREEPQEDIFADSDALFANGEEQTEFGMGSDNEFAFDDPPMDKEAFASASGEEDDFTFSTAEEEDTDAFSFADDGSENAEGDSFASPEKTDTTSFSFEDEESAGDLGEEFSFDEPPQHEEGDFSVGAPKADFDLGPAASTAGAAPAEADAGREPHGEEPPAAPPEQQGEAAPRRPPRPIPKPARTRRKSKSPLTGITIFLLVLLLGLSAAAAYFFWNGGNLNLAQIIETVTGQRSLGPATGKINLKDLSGTYITNREAGTLFVIRGQAVNNYPDPRSAISVKATLYDKTGKVLRQQTVYCGNPLNDEALRNFPFSKIEKGMSNQFGDSLSNLNVAPKQTIPFLVVFRNLPPGLAQFAVAPANSIPGSNH